MAQKKIQTAQPNIAKEMDLDSLQEKINNNSDFRKKLAKDDLLWFSMIYFQKYFFYKTAPFQKEIYKILQAGNSFNEIMLLGECQDNDLNSFHPIWAMVTGKKHHIVLITDTFSQIKDHIYNLKNELENNERLKEDFGTFEVELETQKDRSGKRHQ